MTRYEKIKSDRESDQLLLAEIKKSKIPKKYVEPIKTPQQIATDTVKCYKAKAKSGKDLKNVKCINKVKAKYNADVLKAKNVKNKKLAKCLK